MIDLTLVDELDPVLDVATTIAEVIAEAENPRLLADEVGDLLADCYDQAVEEDVPDEVRRRLVAAMSVIGRRWPSEVYASGLLMNAWTVLDTDPSSALQDAELAADLLVEGMPESRFEAYTVMGYARYGVERFEEAVDAWSAALGQATDDESVALTHVVLSEGIRQARGGLAGAQHAWLAIDEAMARGVAPHPDLADCAFSLQVGAVVELADSGAPPADVMAALEPFNEHRAVLPSDFPPVVVALLCAKVLSVNLCWNDSDRWLADVDRAGSMTGLEDRDVILFSAEAAVLRVENAVCRSDITTAEVLVRRAWLAVSACDDDDLRRRWLQLAALLSDGRQDFATGARFRSQLFALIDSADARVVDDAQRLVDAQREVAAQRFSPSLLAELEQLAARLDRAGAVQMLVPTIAIAAGVAQALGQRARAATLLSRANAVLDEAVAAPPGGFPMEALGSYLDFLDLAMNASTGSGGDSLFASLGRLRDREQASGRTVLADTITAAMSVSALKVDRDPEASFTEAVRAIRGYQRRRGQLPGSGERLAFHVYGSEVVQAAFAAAEALEAQQRLAELIEVIRSHGMPVVRRATPLEEMPLARLMAVDQMRGPSKIATHPGSEVGIPEQELYDAVVVGAPVSIVMPWGSVALVDVVEVGAPEQTSDRVARLVIRR